MIDRKVFFYTTFFLFSLLFAVNFSNIGDQQYSYLANSFISGRLYFIDKLPTWNDTSFYNGIYFWPLGPFPALLLVPFVYISNVFNTFFLQGYLQVFLILLVFILIFKISKHLKYNASDSFILAYTFCFASVFLGVACISWSWQYAQVVGVFLSFLAIYVYLVKKNYLFIGILTGLLLLTRPTTSLIILIFFFDLIINSKKNIKFIKNIFNLFLPYAVCIVIYAIYNYLRFKNIFELGYSYQVIGAELEKARSYGLMSLVHVPGNLYYLLLSMPVPIYSDNVSSVLKFPYITANPWGNSIFITSPYFLKLFFFKYKDTFSKILLLTVVIILIPILLYYGIGVKQSGYRYSLDFLPLLFLLLIKKMKERGGELSSAFKIFVLFLSFFNLYLISTVF